MTMNAARLLMASVVLALALPALGQVTQTQYGRALDANFLIGSGGVNNINPQRYLPGNLYVTGQVTRGRHFRGGVDYAAGNQLSLALPSAGLDDFRRDSYGLDQMGSGSPYLPGAYLSQSRTVLRPRAIDYRLNAPGSSIPRTSYVSAQQTQQLFDRTVQAYQPIVTDMGKILLVDSRIRAVSMADGMAGRTPAGKSALDDYGVVRPSASPLFGIIRKEDERHLAEELSAAERARRNASVDASIAAQVDPRPKAADPLTAGPRATDTLGSGGASVRTGQDVYYDLQQIMNQILKASAAAAKEPADPSQPKRRERLPLPFEDDPNAPAVLRKSPALRRGEKGVVIASLAGTSKDLFNLHMQRAEKLLASGKFYAAAERYRIANVLNPVNPLATLGWSLALFGADEPLSAGLQLRRSLRQFYLAIDMMNTTVDVRRLLGEEMLKTRIEGLEARIKRQGDEVDPSLVLLAAFIRESMGDHDQAVKHAKLLKEMSGDVVLYKGYAQYLLTPEPAAKTPTTQPAK